MTVVVDASVVVAAAIESGERGRWSIECLAGADLVAPHLLPAEVTSALRRAVAGGSIAASTAAAALRACDQLPLQLYPLLPVSDRVWELRDNLTTYDAWYVALAEAHECPLATLDHRLVAAVGPGCEFLVPEI